MAATVTVYYYNSTGPTGATAEGGSKWNREDTLTGTTPVPIPTATGTAFSYHKTFALYVASGGGTTSISNRKIYQNGAPTTGLKQWWTTFSTDTYFQATAAAAVDDVTNDATPDQGSYGAAWQSIPESSGAAATWHAASVAATNSQKNGNYIVCCLGVGNNYTGGAGSAIALPDLKFMYDEA